MNYPRQVVIETTSRCNLSCKGCYRSLGHMDYPQADMDLNLFKSIINQVKPHNPVIIPFSDGEPLLNKNFLTMLKEIHSSNLHYNFSTNGTAMEQHEELMNFALETADSICFSMDGFHWDTIEFYRGIPFGGRILEDRILSDRRRKASIATSLTRQGQDYGEIEEFITFWLNRGINYVIIRNHLDSKPVIGRPYSNYPCKYHEGYYLVIRSDGKVRLCERNMNAPIIGDLTKESIEEVLPRLVEHDVCKTCTQRYCGSGMYGSVRFKSNLTGPPIYFKQDYFNQIYSLKDVQKGISWHDELKKAHKG